MLRQYSLSYITALIPYLLIKLWIAGTFCDYWMIPSYIIRTGSNRMTDLLAKFGCNMDSFEDLLTFTMPPSALLTALEEDRLGMLFVRSIVYTTDYVLRQPNKTFCTTRLRKLDSSSSTPLPTFCNNPPRGCLRSSSTLKSQCCCVRRFTFAPCTMPS